MTRRIHSLAGLLATLTVATFFSISLISEIFGSKETIATVKALIVMPGLLVLIPAVVATGISGVVLSRSRQGRLVAAKKKRMPFIAANGVLILVPCAIFLDRWAAAGTFDTTFYWVQGLEFLAGVTNLGLMGLNIRDGLKMSGAFRKS